MIAHDNRVDFLRSFGGFHVTCRDVYELLSSLEYWFVIHCTGSGGRLNHITIVFTLHDLNCSLQISQ